MKDALDHAKISGCPEIYMRILHNALRHDFVFDTVDEEDNFEYIGPYVYTESLESRNRLILREYTSRELVKLELKRLVRRTSGDSIFVGIDLYIPPPAEER